MKKNIISASLLLLLSFFPALCETVSRSEAQTYAAQFFGNGSAASFVWDGQNDVRTKTAQEPAFHVFNNPEGGWVIIAGDNCLVPVLGYSDCGSFSPEGMPDNVRWWFGRISDSVSGIRSLSLKQTSQTDAAWKSVGVRTKAGDGKLIQTASWDQTAPYNDKCPKYSGKTCLTGCVATAMAITLRHYQWPAKGTGTTPAYRTESNNISVSSNNVGSHTYSWSSMPMTDGGSVTWTTSQKNAVSQLMYDCGTSVEMDYDPDGSGAYSDLIIPALSTYFSFKASARELYRSLYTNPEWFRMLKAEIDADRVVIYGGSDKSEGGHQFVCDGYDSAGNIHINWGWGGSANGYFPVCVIGNDTSVGYKFNCDDSAIIGLEKTTDGAGNASQSLFIMDDEGYDGISLVSGEIKPGQTFTIKAGYICNYGPGDYKSTVKAGLVDRFGNLKEFIGQEKSITLLDNDDDWYDVISSYSCKITGGIAPGDGIKMFYKLGDGSWAPIAAYFNEMTYNQRTYEYTGKVTYYPLSPLGVFDIPMIFTEQSYKAGDSFYFSLIYGQKHASSVVWYYDGKQTADEYVVLTAGKHTVKAVIKFDNGSTTTVNATVNAQ